MPFLAQEHVSIPNKDLLSWTFDGLSYDEDKPIYIDALNPARSISARQAKTLIRKLVAGFRKIGLYYPIFFLAIVAAGGIFAGTNVAYKPFELSHHLKVSRSRFVIANAAFLETLLEGAKAVSIPKESIILFNPDDEPVPSGYTRWTDLLSAGEEDWVRFDDQEIAEETIAALLFSSGTTGLPKAVKLSHRNLIAQDTLIREHKRTPWITKRLLALPMFHAASTPVACTTPLRAGEQAYILRQFDLEKWFWAMQEYQITDMALVPPIAIGIIMSPLRHQYSLKSVRVAYCGAAPLDRRPQARVQELLAPGATFTQVWGMTETSCIATKLYYNDYPSGDTTGSVGHPIPNLDVKLVDENGRDVSEYGVRGEICVRGPTVTRGYYDNAEANARDFDADGFFHTGDVAYCDAKTKLFYIVDRRKELIKVRGFQVAPAELEGILLSHPDIVDVAVIGVTLTRSESSDSEFPRAYVVRRPGTGASLAVEDVKKYIEDRLVYYKRLDGGVVFVPAIPKNASGKILKRILREQAEKEMGAKL
ncbi:hypothetical protein H2203_006367 [Taxawa tesnikishii (nom. ined.)]|nr:hypothetical protein H2203_006367 [Dothideales sp. JES 119]